MQLQADLNRVATVSALAALMAAAGCATTPEHGQMAPTVVQDTAPAARDKDRAPKRPTEKHVVQVPVVEADNAAEPEPVLDPERTIIFEIGSADLPPEARHTIQRVAKILTAKRDLAVHLIGRTDRLGSKEICIAVASKRTEVVEDALTREGVRAKQIRKFTHGCEAVSGGACSSEECQRQRRSVELRIVEKS